MGNICATTKNIKIHVTIKTWNQRSYGLFDFSCGTNQIEQKDVYLTKDNRIVINPQKEIVTFVKEDDLDSIDFNKLSSSLRIMTIDLTNRNIRVNKVGKTISDSLWKSIYPSHEENIVQGDFIRLGKIILKLKHYSFADEKKQKNKDHFELDKNAKLKNNQIQIIIDSIKNNNSNVKRIKNESGVCCRICYDQDSESDPFLELCKCSITNPLHLSCLKKWMQKKGKKKPNIYHYESKEIKCELCQEIYPMSIQYNNTQIFLFSTEIDEQKDYAFFEIYDKKFSHLKGMIFIYLEKNKKIFFGRAEDNDIIFDDISVSRIHSSIVLKNNKLYLEDVNSKFGTHILFTKPIFPYQKRNIRFQMDKYLFIFHFFENKACYCFTKNNKYHYDINPFKVLKINHFVSDSSVIEKSSNSKNVKKNISNNEEILKNISEKIESNSSFHLEESLNNKFDVILSKDSESLKSLLKLIEHIENPELSKSNLNKFITPLSELKRKLIQNKHYQLQKIEDNNNKSLEERKKLINIFLKNKSSEKKDKDFSFFKDEEDNGLKFHNSDINNNFNFK